MEPLADRYVLIGADVDSAQQRFAIPPAFLKGVPGHWVAEFYDRPGRVLDMAVVDPQLAPRAKRYRLASHKGSVTASIPRLWLQNNAARPDDIVSIRIVKGSDGKRLLRFQHHRPETLPSDVVAHVHEFDGLVEKFPPTSSLD